MLICDRRESRDDITRAIKKLRVLGSGFSVLKIGHRQMVQSVPREMNTDTLNILGLAEATAFVTASQLRGSLGWTNDRIEYNLNAFVKDGIAWIDDPLTAELQYWVPSLFSSS